MADTCEGGGGYIYIYKHIYIYILYINETEKKTAGRQRFAYIYFERGERRGARTREEIIHKRRNVKKKKNEKKNTGRNKLHKALWLA